MKILIIIQSRIASTRLFGKVMLQILNRPILSLMYERVRKSRYHSDIVIATSTNPLDQNIIQFAEREQIKVFAGDEFDLVDRHYQVAKLYRADAVVKIPSDCPLIDPLIIDNVISFFLKNYNSFDYVSNLHPATYPDGNDVEIFTFQALEKTWKEAKLDYQREHTTPYIWENTDLFRIGNVEWETGLEYFNKYRLTLDYPDDFELIKQVYENFYPHNQSFGINEIIKFLDQNPEVYNLNKKYLGKYWYDNHIDEVKNIDNYKKMKYGI